MRTTALRFRRLRLAILLLPLVIPGPADGAEPGGRVETAQTPGGQRVKGAITGDSVTGFRFQPEEGGAALPLESVARVEVEGLAPDPSAPSPPFHVLLGPGGRISGRLGAITDGEVRLVDGPGGRGVVVARAGAVALLQRPGEALELADGFEALDPARWSSVGAPEVADGAVREGAKSLRLAADGSAVTCRLAEPLTAGRLELSFLDDARRAAGCRWFVDLTFRGPDGLEPIQVIPGWEDDSLAVRSRGAGPALAVQRLERRPGWHRLTARFGPDRTALAVDSDELAYGDGPGGTLVEIRLATERLGPGAPGDLAARVDDLRLVRFAEPTGPPEVDPTQDDVRLVTGDQIYGRLTAADASGVTIRVVDQPARLGWKEVAGLYFRRAPAPATALAGLWARVRWRSGPGPGPHDLDTAEGVLAGVSGEALSLEAPYAGSLTIPRDRVADLTVLGRTRRLVLDATAHHLGNTITPGLDPPQPQGGTLDVAFDLGPAVPPGPAAVALDVVQAIGIAGDPNFSDLVRQGELLTHVALNGERFDNLNRHITALNEAPARIRLPVPEGALRPGRNVLRFEQVGTKDDPEKLDNLGLLGIALEFPIPLPEVKARP